MNPDIFPHRSDRLCPSCSEPLLCCYTFSRHSEVILSCTGSNCRSNEAELGAHGIDEAEAFEFLKANVEAEAGSK